MQVYQAPLRDMRFVLHELFADHPFGELEHFAEYDYLVVNDNLETALNELSSIYVAARCARTRRGHYGHDLLEEAQAQARGQPASST